MVLQVFIVLKKPLSDPLDYNVAIPPLNNILTLYLNKFAENQLSPDSISFSLLITTYPI